MVYHLTSTFIFILADLSETLTDAFSTRGDNNATTALSFCAACRKRLQVSIAFSNEPQVLFFALLNSFFFTVQHSVCDIFSVSDLLAFLPDPFWSEKLTRKQIIVVGVTCFSRNERTV